MRKILYFSFLFLLGLFMFGCKEETIKYIVTFDVDGELTTSEVKYNEKVSKPLDPVKDGYIFLGWYLGEEDYDFEKEVTSDITLVAKFEEIKYVVTFDVDGEFTTSEVKYNEKVSKPLDPVKDGYIFTGWYLGEEEYDFEKEVTSDITLVAMFKKANKVITKIKAASSIYNAFKGEGSLADISNKGYIYYDNTKEEISINWDYSLIDLNKEGTYSLKGSIDIPNGYELDSNIANEVYMDINIKQERKVIKEIYELDKFECFMAEKTIEDLPLTCEVLLNDGTKEEILCIWDYRLLI